MNEHVVVVLVVDHEIEADAAIAALNDAGIAAYKKAEPNPGLLAMPGAYGLAENGINIVVKKEDGAKAAAVLVGIGHEPLVEPADPEEAEAEPEAKTIDQQKEELAKEYAQLHPFKRFLMLLLVLLMVAGIVWMTDFIVELVKSLL